MNGTEVKLYYDMILRVPTAGGGYQDKIFQEEELHRPLIDANNTVQPSILTGANLYATYTNPQPRKGHQLDEIELNVDYDLFIGLGGMRKLPKVICLSGVKDAGNNPDYFEIYGWIDSIRPIATKGPNSNTLISWHVDYWYTLQKLEWNAIHSPAVWRSRNLSYGIGTFKRGPAAMARPDPSSPTKWKYKSSLRIKNLVQAEYRGNWAIILYSTSSSGWNNNKIAFFPINGNITGSGQCPGDDTLFEGNVLTLLGTTSDKVIGAWFSPIPLNSISVATVRTSGGYAWYETNYTGTSAGVAIATVTENTTSDTQKVVITDQVGNPIYTLPWGTTYDTIRFSLDIGANGTQLLLAFTKSDPDNPFAIWEPAETDGRFASIPLMPIPMYSNAMSDYIYSGQRNYDIQNAKLQREQAMQAGIANLGSSVIGGAVAGTVAAPGAGTVAGAVGGLASGILGTAANALISTHYDIKGQELTDRLVANQAGSLVISGGGDYAFRCEYGASIITLEADALSKGSLEAEQEELGYTTHVFAKDCSAIVGAGGPMRIEGLEVKGSITTTARAYIQQMFTRGVHLDLIY